jgi:hypothetical protein
VADGDESLLDVFVNIKPDPGFMAAITASAEAAINEYARVFAAANLPAPSVRPPNVSGGATGGGGGGTGGGGGSPANQAANDLRNQLRQAILEFQRDKAFLEVDVRIANDKDLQLRLKNLTSAVAGEAGVFRTTDDENEQAAAIQRIIEFRTQELAVLRQVTAEQIRAAGLTASAFDRSQGFREQRDAVESSLLGVKGVGKAITAAGDNDISRQFRVLNEQLDSAKLRLSQGLRAENLIDVTEARERIQRITYDIDALRIKAEAKIVIDLQVKADQAALKEQFDFIADNAKEMISKSRIENKLQASLIQGLPSGEQRQNIAKQQADLELAELNVRRLSQAYDGQQDSVDRLKVAVQELANAQLGLKLLYQDAQTAAVSMNTLSNNAYQLGQAFEDFAVGYSLNGIAGGIRGAANNVAFLLNSLSQSKVFTEALTKQFIALKGNIPADQAAKMAEKFSTALPLVAGIGSALAIIVVPKIVEWLESLNDIQTRFTDISDLVSREFSDVKFSVGLLGGERDFARSIEKAKELRDVLQKLGEVAENSADKSDDLKRLFEGLDEGESLSRNLNQLREGEKLFRDRRTALKEIVDITSKFPGNDGATGPLNSEKVDEQLKKDIALLRDLEGQVDNVSGLYNNLRIARENGLTGNSDASQLRLTVRLFQELKETVEKTFKDMDLADEEASKTFTSTLSSVQDVITELSQAAQEIESFTNQLTDGLTSAQKKIEEFTEIQEVIRRTITGTANDQTLFTLEVQKSAQEFQTLIEKIREAKLALAPTQELRNLVNREADAAREALRIETETELLLRQKEVRDEIAKGSGKSSITNFEQYVQGLQKNALSFDPLDKNTQELATLTAAISELNANMRLGGSPEQALRATPLGGFGNFNALGFALESMAQIRPENFNTQAMPDATANAIAGALNIAVREAMKEFVAPVVGAQGATTDAVRKLNVGARAQ